jgi:hypothetical protein
MSHGGHLTHIGEPIVEIVSRGTYTTISLYQIYEIMSSQNNMIVPAHEPDPQLSVMIAHGRGEFMDPTSNIESIAPVFPSVIIELYDVL